MPISYLHKINKIYYFRIRIPQDLQSHLGRTIFKVSLKTGDLRSAKTLCKVLAGKLYAIFTSMRSSHVTQDSMQELVREYVEQKLNAFETLRLDIQKPKNGTLDILEIPQIHQKFTAVMAKINLENRDYLAAETLLDNILQEKAIALEKGSQEYKSLCRALLRAEVEINRIEEERKNGNYNNDYDRFLEKLFERPTKQHSPQQNGIILSTHQTLASEVINLFLRFQMNVKKIWEESTYNDIKSILDLFLRICGDKAMEAYTSEELQECVEVMATLPPNINKNPKYRDKTIDEILAMKYENTVAENTLKKRMDWIQILFEWALKGDYVSKNRADGLTFRKKKGKKDNEERDPYEKSDLDRVVNSLCYDPARPERFWVPIIGPHSGMRLDEICQLYVDDVKYDDYGIPYFDINAELDKSVKNDVSWRCIPIHPILIKLGFLEYVEKLRKEGKVRLWEQLKWRKKGGYGKDFGKWYQDFNRYYITKDKKKVFHSFRHNMEDIMKKLRIEEVLRNDILGHANKGEGNARYGKNCPVLLMREVFDMIDYGIDVEILKAKLQSPCKYPRMKKSEKEDPVNEGQNNGECSDCG
jgi:integrase